MSFVETDFAAPTRHNPELHAIVLDEMREYPEGAVLDVPSGPGYLGRDLTERGFRATCGEIDERLHCLQGVDYRAFDMSGRFPFADGAFDYVVSIEGIEHIENQFAFLREVRRVLRPGGRLLLTTPNVGNLASRLYHFLCGFHSTAPGPISARSPNPYFEHINPIGLAELYFACSLAGLEVETLRTHRYKRGAKLLYYMVGPIARRAARAACSRPGTPPGENDALYRMLVSRENLLGSHTIITARAVRPPR